MNSSSKTFDNARRISAFLGVKVAKSIVFFNTAIIRWFLAFKSTFEFSRGYLRVSLSGSLLFESEARYFVKTVDHAVMMMKPANILVDERLLIHGDYHPSFCRMYSDILINNPEIKQIAVIVKSENMENQDWRTGYQSLRYSNVLVFTEIQKGVDWLAAGTIFPRMQLVR